MQFDDLRKYWLIVQEKVKSQKKQIAILKKKKIKEVEEALLPPVGSAPYEYRKAYEFACRPPEDYEEAPRRPPPENDKPYRSLAEYARGIRLLELQSARQNSCHRVRDYVSMAKGDYSVPREQPEDGEAVALAPYQQGAWPVDNDEFVGFEVHVNPMAFLVSPEDRILLARILELSPGRKRGRPPKGDRPMTGAERVRKHRSKEPA